LKVFENKALKVFGAKREEVSGSWKRLHNGEVCNLCGNQIKDTERDVACSTQGRG